jgi:hypothetical protein
MAMVGLVQGKHKWGLWFATSSTTGSAGGSAGGDGGATSRLAPKLLQDQPCTHRSNGARDRHLHNHNAMQCNITVVAKQQQNNQSKKSALIDYNFKQWDKQNHFVQCKDERK